MPNYIEYQKSVAAEFKAYENRVRNLIDDHHWGEDGRYKEIILMNYLKRVLPAYVSVGTGFVKSKESLTRQIDIIIYKNTYPTLFSEGDFVILIPESVIGIIEVKSKISDATHLREYIMTANENANIICGNSEKRIFNGIFSYNCSMQNETIYNSLNNLDYGEILSCQFNQICSNKLFNCVNHMVLSDKKFIKLWPTGQDTEVGEPYYSIYNLNESLAFAYFISNLQEYVMRYMSGRFIGELPDVLNEFLYPLPEGKEGYLYKKVYLKK